MNKRKRLLALLINGVLLSSLSCVAMAAPDTSIGTGNGVAYGTGSKAPEFKNIAIGNDAEVYYANGTNRPATGDIAIGSGAHTHNYVNQGGGIAIGEKGLSVKCWGVHPTSLLWHQSYVWLVPFFLLKSRIRTLNLPKWRSP